MQKMGFIMKRNAFTMIELIFVIVILGILASIAIPKLAATRDDANVAKAAMEIASALNDMGSYYTSQGNFNHDASIMTNVKLTQQGGGSGAIASDGSEIWDYMIKNENCIDMNATGDGNISVIVGASSVSICQRLQRAVQHLILESPHSYGGDSVKFE